MVHLNHYSPFSKPDSILMSTSNYTFLWVRRETEKDTCADCFRDDTVTGLFTLVGLGGDILDGLLFLIPISYSRSSSSSSSS